MGTCPAAPHKPHASLFRSWNTARHKAGLPDVRIHDPSHAWASLLINQGRSLYEVQRLLGHTQAKNPNAVHIWPQRGSWRLLMLPPWH